MMFFQNGTGVPGIVLASGSRYRRELLERLRIPFLVVQPGIDETPLPSEAPSDTAKRLAEDKALFVARSHPGALVIGSDQVATLDGSQLGKPGNHDNALGQLRMLRGRTALFHTALCLVDTRASLTDALRLQSATVTVEVRFRDLPDDALDAYLRLEQPYDCAGSAKAEGLGIALVESIHSDDPTALIGLPLTRLVTMLQKVGYPLFRHTQDGSVQPGHVQRAGH